MIVLRLARSAALSISLLVLLASSTSRASHVTTVVTLTPPSLPEGLVIDRQGTMYLSMVPTGEIRRITPNGDQTTVATLRPGAAGFLVALALDSSGDIYAALASHNAPNTDTHGVWRIQPNGTKSLYAALPDLAGIPNQLAFDKTGNLFVSDSELGKIWRVTPQGQVSLWLDHPLLKADVDACSVAEPLPVPVGVNGIGFDHRGDFWAVNGDHGHVLRIPVHPKTGAAGSPEIFVSDCALEGADGFAFDVNDSFYLALNGQNKLVRISPNGRIETLATAADGLDFPTNLAFGVLPGDQTNLYFANLAILSVIAERDAAPSIMKTDVGVRGLPIP